MFRRVSPPLTVLCFMGAAGCGDTPAPRAVARATYEIPVDVRADTGAMMTMPRPLAALHMGSVREAATPPSSEHDVPIATPPRAMPEAPQPQGGVEIPPEDMPPPAGLVVDPGLKPPILKVAATLVLPAGVSHGSVTVDVRVDPTGRVSEARWAGGATEPALVDAALACARRATYYPALRNGTPVAVWCQQRIDVGERSAGR